MRTDKEAQVRGVCETVESHLWSIHSRQAYRKIRTVRSARPPPRCSTVKAADGTTLTGKSEIRARCAGYFERLYRVDPPGREFPGDVEAVRDADSPVSCDPPSLEETKRAVDQVKCGKAPGGCGICAEMLKAGRAAVFLWLHTLLCSIWNTGVIQTDWRRGVVVPIWKGKGDTQECNNYRGVSLLSVPGKVLARILLDRVCQKLLTHQRHEQSSQQLLSCCFTPEKSTVDRILALCSHRASA